MYVPKAFAVTDEAQLLAFARANNFATLITRDPVGGMTATHVPVLVDPVANGWVVRGHIARANPQVLEGEALVVFSGPHAYISPTWYVEPNRVPTWDYVAVHVSGAVERLEARDELHDIVYRLSSQHEAPMRHPWPAALPTELEDRLLRNITGFRVTSSAIRGAWKLSQNQSLESRKSVVTALRARGSDDEKAIADLIEQSKV